MQASRHGSNGADMLGPAQRWYRAALNFCRKAVQRDKKQYWQAMSESLEKDFRAHNLHSAYRRLNMRDELKRTQPLGAGLLRAPEGGFARTAAHRNDIQRRHFSRLLNCKRETQLHVWQHTPNHVQQLPQMDHPPSLQEVESAIEKLKNNKAAGACLVLPEIIKHGGTAVARVLHKLIIVIWQTGRAPDDRKKSLLVPILKKGDPTVIDNYRGISLLRLPGKVYALLLHSRLSQWADGLLLEGQCCFRKNRGCTDAIFSFKSLCEQAMRKQRQLHTCFIDLQKAYDSIDRELAWKVLLSRGAPDKLVSLIADIEVPSVHCNQIFCHQARGLKSTMASSREMSMHRCSSTSLMIVYFVQLSLY